MKTSVKFCPTTESGSARTSTPPSIAHVAMPLPTCSTGYVSPYPTVVIVTTDHQKVVKIEVNGDSLPSERRKSVSPSTSVGVPCSA